MGDLLAELERRELAEGIMAIIKKCLDAFFSQQGIKPDREDREDIEANIVLRFFQFIGFFAEDTRRNDFTRYVNILTLYTCIDFYRLGADVLDSGTRDFLRSISSLLLARLEDGGDRWEVEFTPSKNTGKRTWGAFFIVKPS